MPNIRKNIRGIDLPNDEDVKRFLKFLKDHEVCDDIADKTHYAFGHPFGKYWINDHDMVTFNNLYKRILSAYIKAGITDPTLHIIERPRLVGPLAVDLDFRQAGPERLYDEDTIKFVVSKCNELIKKYVRVNQREIEAFVTEKAEPSHDEKQKNYKDGFHVLYPRIGMPASLRYKIQEELLAITEREGGLNDIEHTNTLAEIFDTSVVMRNGWCMYGSRKKDSQPYLLTHIYNHQTVEQRCTYQPDELVVLLSVRQHDQDEPQALSEPYDTDAFRNELQKTYDKYHAKRGQKNRVRLEKLVDNADKGDKVGNGGNGGNGAQAGAPRGGPVRSSPSDIETAKKLVAILSKKRATEYHGWVRVGWALRNVDDTLLDTFIAFSKQIPGKYQPGCCEEVWNGPRYPFTIASLYWWAKEDNPDGYLEVLRERVLKLIREAESGSHDDIAKVVYELYKFNYRCASIKKNVWYEFQGHRWVVIDSGYTLANKLSDEVTNEFAKLASQYFAESVQKQGIEKDHLMAKAKDICKIVDRLKNQGFKASILIACSHRFYDGKFEEKLDENPYLLGFKNGVYDLKNHCFRPGVPDDYMTMSVGYDYKEFNRKDPEVKEIEDYFKKVMREEDMRKYILMLISSYLAGTNKDQKFILWTGSGSNAKSTSIDLISYTFGDYFGVLPVTILTKKRAAAGNATPELADKRGKRFLAIQEPEHDDTIYVGLMKELTGSDWVVARALYGDPFRYKPQFKLVLTCNKLPQIPSHDGGTWRRLRVSPWESEFVDGVPKLAHQFPKDPLLAEKLKQWPQAFIWLLLNVYYPDYDKNGLQEPKKVTQFTDKYKKDTDTYHEYLSENMVITRDSADSESLMNMYTSFKSWYNEAYSNTKMRACPARKEFMNYLNDSGYKVENGKVSGVKFMAREVSI